MYVCVYIYAAAAAKSLQSHFSRVWLCATPETAAHQASLSLGISRQEHWSGVPLPSLVVKFYCVFLSVLLALENRAKMGYLSRYFITF